ncbi:MAG: Hpt domain-containing protein, partial [candidate division NC10 bacterium]
RDLFVSETREHLVSLNRALLALEKNPDDPALLDEIFRSMHTIKGMAGSIGSPSSAPSTCAPSTCGTWTPSWPGAARRCGSATSWIVMSSTG